MIRHLDLEIDPDHFITQSRRFMTAVQPDNRRNRIAERDIDVKDEITPLGKPMIYASHQYSMSRRWTKKHTLAYDSTRSAFACQIQPELPVKENHPQTLREK